MAEAAVITWARTRADMAADRRRLRTLLGYRPGLFHRGVCALRLYRVAFWMFHRRGLRVPARMLWALNLILTRADIDPSAPIGPGAVLAEPSGVIVFGELGADCTIGRRVVIGGLIRSKPPPPDMKGERPEIAAEVVLGDGAMVLGALRVGRGARIGDGCSVMDSIPAAARLRPREAGWRVIRVVVERPPRPNPAPANRLIGRIRADVERAVLDNTGRLEVGALRLWGHLIMPGVAGVALFRVAQALHAAGWRRAGALVARLVAGLTGMMLHPGSVVGPGFFVPHPVGVRFCGTAGPYLTLLPHARVGPATWPALTSAIPEDAPVFGKDAMVGARGEVVGGLRIGDGATVGVGVRLDRDLAAGLAAVAQSNWRLVPQAEPEDYAAG